MILETELVVRLMLAAFLGAVVGLEREMAHRPAGLRTNALVSLGACMFTIIAIQYFGASYAGIVAGIVTGTGFLGAGVIINSGQQVQGTTTAATLWAVAAIGMGVGIGAYLICVVSTILALFVLKLKKFEGPLKRRR